ncbi:AraC family transcriptional regulator [Acidovorax sp. FG27]|uniref:AraC family transcriptional regulator n=1 Tax=Acidovorax sp. FG27 TaxID=3133652 RepID=UPI0030EAD5FF
MTLKLLKSLNSELDAYRPENIEQLVSNMWLLLPILDAVPNAAIFIKDAHGRYLLANRTLVERCGLNHLKRLIGKTSAEVFPTQLGSAYTEQDQRVLEQGVVLGDQLELHLFVSREPGWCLTHKRPVRGRDDQIIGLIGISLDLPSASGTHPAYPRLVAVDEHIRNHFHGAVTMKELTCIAGMSVAQLERYCKRIFHLTPRQMIHKARLEHAHRLLHTDLQITEIALQCGYTDHSAFTRQFKLLTGLTPSQYRDASA